MISFVRRRYINQKPLRCRTDFIPFLPSPQLAFFSSLFLPPRNGTQLIADQLEISYKPSPSPANQRGLTEMLTWKSITNKIIDFRRGRRRRVVSGWVAVDGHVGRRTCRCGPGRAGPGRPRQSAQRWCHRWPLTASLPRPRRRCGKQLTQLCRTTPTEPMIKFWHF